MYNTLSLHEGLFAEHFVKIVRVVENENKWIFKLKPSETF